MKQDHLKQLLANKRILIYGLGREGESTLRFLKKYIPSILKIDVLEEGKVSLQLPEGVHCYHSLDPIKPQDYDLVFKSPGIPLRKCKVFSPHQITSQLDIFLACAQGKVIGVTGTKGKSTTSAFIYHILKSIGLTTLLVGNIGQPSLDLLDQTTSDTITVYEMSSGQLETAHYSPHMAVWLNFFSEHLDFHDSLDTYWQAKFNITRYQNSSNILFCHHHLTEKIQTQACRISFLPESEIYQSLSLQLIQQGIFLHPPTLAVGYEVGSLFKKDFKKEDFYNHCLTYHPLQHRMQSIKSARGVIYLDDMLATIPEATIAALRAFQPATLIVGGKNRGVDYTSLIQEILYTSSLRTLICMPDTGTIISSGLIELMNERSDLLSTKRLKIYLAETPLEAVQYAEQYTSSGERCLLSPAAPSYNQFANYKAKASAFRQAIESFASIES